MQRIFILMILLTFPLVSALPDGFVYVTDIEPTIIESIRYASHENFVGTQIRGYKSGRAILTKETALALQHVQRDMLKDGYCLVIYDAYRPQKAVDHFVEWGADLTDLKTKDYYYPRVNKTEVFEQGYVALRSSHSRGSTVDITLISINNIIRKALDIQKSNRMIDTNSFVFLDDNTLDMGSSFDLFDLISHHDCALIDKEYVSRRNYLRSIMQKHGFKGIRDEWWHYTLKGEPFPDTYFNFDVE